MKYIIMAVSLAVAFMLSACAGLQSNDATTKLIVQYGTMKVIEQSDSVTADGVLRVVDEAREVANRDDEVRIIDVRERVLEAIGGLSRFSPADQLLIVALLDQVQAELVVSVEGGALSEDDLVQLHTLLDWVEQAAVMAGGEV